MPMGMRPGRAVVTAGALASTVLAAQVAFNLTRVKTPRRPERPVGERVSVLLPLRNEAHRVTPCLEALLALLRDEIRTGRAAGIGSAPKEGPEPAA